MAIDFAPLPPKEAIAFFQRKGYRIGFSWQDVWEEEHAAAFTVAKAMSLDILDDIRSAVDRALEEGATLRDFRRELEPTLRAKGWWGKKKMRDPLTGKEKIVQLGSPRRLETIFNTNLRTTYAAGHWEQIQRTKARRPYLRYVHLDNAHPRPQHKAWHGLVLPVDDLFWRQHFPPNGWGCHCTAQQLSDRDLRRYGYTVSKRPPMPTREFVNRRTGEVRQVPVGIDPGFGHNVGYGAEGAAKLFAEKIAAVPADLGAAAWADAKETTIPPLSRGFARLADELSGGAAATGEVWPVGALSRDTLGFLQERGLGPSSAALLLRDRELKQMLHGATDLVLGVPVGMLRELPRHLASPAAVLWDGGERELLYVFDMPAGAEAGQVVVRVETDLAVPLSDDRGTLHINRARSAELVDARTLRDPATYQLVEGKL